MIVNQNIEALKERYPVGTRIELIYMDDTQAPPVGTQGTVKGIDGIGDILVQWDTGSTLNVIPDVDEIKVV